MNFLSLVGVELKKIRRSKILLILLIPIVLMWIPSIINADINFDLRGIPITPENNFFIQGFMGMVWFMIPASLVICTVLLNQTERSNKGILKMLSLPISTTKLCLAKFTVLILLAAFQMVMSIGAYYICAAIVTHTQDYNFILEPLYVCKNVCSIYAAAIPMAAVYLAVSTLNQLPRCKHSSTVLGSYVAAHSTCLSLLLPQARKRGMRICLSLLLHIIE